MLDEEVILIDIFSPLREDFLPGGGRGAAAVSGDGRAE